MLEIRRILCPVDYSDASRHAIEHASALARWYDATVVGLHVYYPGYVPLAGLDVVEPAPLAVDDGSRLQAELEAALRAGSGPPVHVEALLDQGPPASRILAAATAQRADLVVMGTHGSSGFERLLLGSVTEKVVRKAPCPVLTVPPRAHSNSVLPFRRILCAVDFSRAANDALELALSLAQEAQAALDVVHVLEWVAGEPHALPHADVLAYRALREKQAAAALANIVPAAARDWCSARTHLRHGKPYREILAMAGGDGADLIVIGVHGHDAVDRLLFGSTTNQVIRGASCPVLTVR